jgi:virginiamycin B lyase
VWAIDPGGVPATKVTVSQVNPATFRRIAHLSIGDGGIVTHVAVLHDDVWVTDGIDRLIRIDAFAVEIVEQIELPVTPDWMAAGEGAVWIANDLAGAIHRLDPVTGEVGDEISVQGAIDGIAAGA